MAIFIPNASSKYVGSINIVSSQVHIVIFPSSVRGSGRVFNLDNIRLLCKHNLSKSLVYFSKAPSHNRSPRFATSRPLCLLIPQWPSQLFVRSLSPSDRWRLKSDDIVWGRPHPSTLQTNGFGGSSCWKLLFLRKSNDRIVRTVPSGHNSTSSYKSDGSPSNGNKSSELNKSL